MRQIFFALMIACISITNIQCANATPSAPPISTALDNDVAASSDLTLRDTCTQNTQNNHTPSTNTTTDNLVVTPPSVLMPYVMVFAIFAGIVLGFSVYT